MSCEKLFTVIIPARNESAQIGSTVMKAVEAAAYFEDRSMEGFDLSDAETEIIVVDNSSTDGTRDIVKSLSEAYGVTLLHCPRLGAAAARNYGKSHARGSILVFIDADTWIPQKSLRRIRLLHEKRKYEAGIFKLGSQEGGLKAWCWWTFWNCVRMLPLARAKAMPAFMFCTNEVFERYGPFDEEFAIGEEWPILAGLYNTNSTKLVYDRSLTALSSSRRMDMQRFGYIRSFLKYVWVVLHKSGRIHHSDGIRQTEGELP